LKERIPTLDHGRIVRSILTVATNGYVKSVLGCERCVGVAICWDERCHALWRSVSESAWLGAGGGFGGGAHLRIEGTGGDKYWERENWEGLVWCREV
jgi:hypothetical protein